MAEPDYLEGDCDELIKPKKLINPVKNSRNHQDLHRELLMNQKRSDPDGRCCSPDVSGGSSILTSISRQHPCCFPLIGLIVSMQPVLVLRCVTYVSSPIPSHLTQQQQQQQLYKPLDMKLSYKLLHKASIARLCQLLVM